MVTRNMLFSGNGFSDHDASTWAEAIEENKYCKVLNLSRNYFGDTGGVILGPALGNWLTSYRCTSVLKYNIY